MKIPMNFISAREDFSTREKYIPLPYFRRRFEIKDGLEKAELIIGALGFYEVHINAKDITKGEMSPYRSNPDHFVYFDRYDITDLLTAGENVLAAILGNGMQNSTVKMWGRADFPWRSAPALSFEIKLTYADGTKEKIVSDENTLASDSPVLFSDFQFGEYYDARLEQPGWDEVGFDDGAWHKSIARIAPRGEARFCESEPITVQSELKPVEILKFDEGYVYDFGVNEAGIIRLHINGDPGQKLVFRYFETMVDGKPYFKNLKYKDHERFQEDEYICAGGEATHKPRFNYQGCRYVMVEGLKPTQATPELLTFLTVHTNVA